MPTYTIYLYSASLVVALCVNWFLLKKYAQWGVKNHSESGEERWVAISKPAVGGIGFFIIFLLTCLLLFVVNYAKPTLLFQKKFIGFALCVFVGFWVGLVDDRKNMPPWFKFFGQLVCTLILFFSGIFIELNAYTVCNFLLTLFWVVGIMNSINMLDNMDGITATTSFFIIIGCIIAMFSPLLSGVFSIPIFVMAIAILGGISGFLKYNWASAKMYMGDSGSQFLGAFLAGLSIMYLWQVKNIHSNSFIQWQQFAIPLIAFVVPIIDTTTVSIRRVARGQSPLVGGRDHTTHQLAIAGLTDGQVGLVFMAINAFSACLIYGLLIANSKPWHTAYTVGAFLYFVVLFGAFQWVYWWNGKQTKSS